MKRFLVMLIALAAFAAFAGCGGGSGDSNPGGGDGAGGGDAGGSENNDVALSQSEAEVTARSVSLIALSILQQVGEPGPAGMVISKETIHSMKDGGSFSAMVEGRDAGSCTAYLDGSSSTSADPMTFDLAGSMECNSFSDSATIDYESQKIGLDGSVNISLTGSVAQDYSSITIEYELSWSNLNVAIGENSYVETSGNYRLTIAGSIGSLTFTETGTVGNQDISTTYTFESNQAGVPENSEVPEELPSGEDEDVIPENVIIGSPRYVIFAQDGQFLGFINTNRFDSESVCNGFGSYGNKYSSTSIWNKLGTYGGSYNAYSAFNDLGATPPIILEYDGSNLIPIYYLTTNGIKSPRINAYNLLNYLVSQGCNISR